MLTHSCPTRRSSVRQADAELAQYGNDLGFEVARPQRVFALQCRHRMHGVGAADVGDAGFGQTKVAYLALPYEVTDRAGHVLDRYVAVDAEIGRASCRERVCQYV